MNFPSRRFPQTCVKPRKSKVSGRCAEAGVRPSLGSVGEAYDNAMAESFFATLECELLDRRRFRSQAEARMAVFSYIEGWYNPSRRHSALGYLSPVSYEEQTRTEP
jgi:putative transposase